MSVIVIIFAIIFIALTFSFFKTDLYKSERFAKYTSVISVLATLSIVVSFFINIRSNAINDQRRLEQEEKDRQRDFEQETQRYWIDVEKMFIENYPYLNNLYSELYPDNPNIKKIILTGNDLFEQQNLEQHVCQILYQTIENIYNTKSIDPNFGWQPIFKSWAKSNVFRTNWKYSRRFYNLETQKYIDSLINQN